MICGVWCDVCASFFLLSHLSRILSAHKYYERTGISLTLHLKLLTEKVELSTWLLFELNKCDLTTKPNLSEPDLLPNLVQGLT